MSERFRLLTAGGGRPSRQATLRAALDWSWDLLGAEERDAFAQLAVFEGGFNLDAAEAVVAAGTWPADLVQALVEKSLVRRADNRFSQLISVHEYARERLVETAHRAEAERRHGEHYARVAGVEPWRREKSVERDNFAAASRRAATRGDVAIAAATALATWRCVATVGPFSVGLDVLTAAAAITAGEQAMEVALARVAALTAMGMHAEARAVAEEALRIARALGHPRLEAQALVTLASRMQDLGDLDGARMHFEHVLEVAQSLQDVRLEFDAWAGLGVVEVYARRRGEARAALERALALARQLGDRTSEAVQRTNLAVLALNEGRDADAREDLEWVLVHDRETGNRRSEANTLTNLGTVHHQMAHGPEAEAAYLAALQIRSELGNLGTATVRMNLGALYVSTGKLAGGAPLVRAGARGRRRERGEAPRGLRSLERGQHRRHPGPSGRSTRTLRASARRVLARSRPRRRRHRGARPHRHPGGSSGPGLERVLALPDKSADFWQTQATLAVMYAARGDLPAARAAIERCRALPTMVAEDTAFVAAAEARVAAAEGDVSGARKALGRATAVAHWAGPGTEVGRVVDETRALLDR